MNWINIWLKYACIYYSFVDGQLPPPPKASCDFCTPFNFAWLPPTVHSNCSERLWLYARAILVIWEKRAWLLPFNNLLKFLPPPAYTYAYAYVVDLQQLLKRKYSAQICHYRRGGNLMIFDKDDDTVEREQLWSSYSQAWNFWWVAASEQTMSASLFSQTDSSVMALSLSASPEYLNWFSHLHHTISMVG